MRRIILGGKPNISIDGELVCMVTDLKSIPEIEWDWWWYCKYHDSCCRMVKGIKGASYAYVSVSNLHEFLWKLGITKMS